MKRVVLLVTGQTEKALGPSLQRVFPNVEFVVRGPWGGFTSNALPETPLLKRLGNAPEETYLEKLVGLLVSEVAPGRRNEKPADMVVSGEAALRRLDWALVFGRAEYVRFIRSLLFDIADALNEAEIVNRFAGTTHPSTGPPSKKNILRNI